MLTRFDICAKRTVELNAWMYEAHIIHGLVPDFKPLLSELRQIALRKDLLPVSWLYSMPAFCKRAAAEGFWDTDIAL